MQYMFLKLTCIQFITAFKHLNSTNIITWELWEIQKYVSFISYE